MIKDHITYAEGYFGMNDKIKQALHYLRNPSLPSMEPGKYEIDGKQIFAIINRYETTEADRGIWEGHRQYIDIHYMIQGKERIGYAPIHHMEETKTYDQENDYALFQGEGTFIEIQEGDFIILAPQDIHMTSIAVQEKETVIKAVIKVAV